MVKGPVEAQPFDPVKVQFPVIVFATSDPFSVSVLPDGLPDVTTNLSVPVTVFCELVVTIRVPLSVSPETKHVPVVRN